MSEHNNKKIQTCTECKQLILKGNDKRIISLISKRMNDSYIKYNNTPIPISDGRDWTQETIEELLDAMVYITNKLLQIKEYNNKGV